MDSRSRDESSKIGEGSEVEIGGTTKVISFDFVTVLTDSFLFFWCSDVDGTAASVEADETIFLEEDFFLDLPLEIFLEGLSGVVAEVDGTTRISERTAEEEGATSIADG